MVKPLKGRPTRHVVEELIKQGEKSKSPIKCFVCQRVFVRSKSLRTHITTHLDTKLYVCDFPGCSRRFNQSNQLANHIRIHSTENPFKCPFEGCNIRLKHSNRFCTTHTTIKVIEQLQHADEIRKEFYEDEKNHSEANRIWFEKFLCEREKSLSAAAKGRKNAIIKGKEKASVKGKKKGGIKYSHVIKKNSIMKVINSVGNDVSMKASYSELDDKSSSEDVSMKESNSEEDDVGMEVSSSEDISAALSLYFFVEYLKEKGENSKALFEKQCQELLHKTQN